MYYTDCLFLGQVTKRLHIYFYFFYFFRQSVAWILILEKHDDSVWQATFQLSGKRIVSR